MIDLHSHINFAVDDGARDIDEALEMAADALRMGYTKILCTPHFRYPRFINDSSQENFIILQKELKKQEVEIEVILGNELYLEPENIKALKEGKVKTMGKSKYVLVEASPSMPYKAYKGALQEVEELGYKPVLAHIERYFFNLQEIRELHSGYPVQVNISSIGLEMKKRIKILAQENLIDILATDSHRTDRRSYRLSEELQAFKELLGGERFKLLTEINPEKILKDEEIIKNGGKDEKLETVSSSKSFFARILSIFRSRAGARRDS